MNKRSSLFSRTVNDEEKKGYNITIKLIIRSTHFLFLHRIRRGKARAQTLLDRADDIHSFVTGGGGGR
jgi:hypothetical protein